MMLSKQTEKGRVEDCEPNYLLLFECNIEANNPICLPAILDPPPR